MTETAARETELRDRAVKRLKKRRDFYAHVMVYLLVNAFIVIIWWMTSPGGFFWPVFPIVGWGIGVVMNAWDVYFGQNISEEDIQREIEQMEHLR